MTTHTRSLPEALRNGATRLMRLWPLIALAYIANTLSAAFLTLPLTLIFAPLLNRPSAWGADASPGALWIEALRATNILGAPTPGAPDIAAALGAVVLGTFALFVSSSILTSFTAGALALLHAQPARFTLSEFLRGVWRWLFLCVMLNVFEVFTTSLVVLLTLAFVFMAGALGGGAVAGLLGVLLFLGATLWIDLATDATRIASVAQSVPGQGWHLGALTVGLRAIAARPLAWVALFVLGNALTLAVLVAVSGPLAALPAAVVLLVQQLGTLARVTMRLWRTATALALVEAHPA